MGGAAAAAGGGLESKKEPPLSADFEAGGIARDCADGEVRFENADALGWDCEGEVKDRELKASFIPPNCWIGCGCWFGEIKEGGDCMPEKAFIFDCTCCGCCGGGAGFEA